MSGLSLACGDCGLLLKNTKEAQDHAELTSHSNFVESTEAVLSLVCVTCGKPCRSKEEVEIHKVRTGHQEFTDKTVESAKPLNLEESNNTSAKEGNSEDKEELVVPEVNVEIKEELISMGFPEARSIRALHFSGNTDVESAVNWIVEHENDPDIDEIPKVPAGQKNKKHLSAEEAKAKAQELVERARKKKEEEEKRMEREREIQRIRAGKELLEAKRKEEEQERKRIIALKQAEKLEEKRARERVKAKIEEDKMERRRKLGLPLEDPPKKQAPAENPEPAKEENKGFVRVKPVSKAEQFRSLLREMKHAHQAEDAKVKVAFETLMKFIANVATRPEEEKFRKIRMSNPAFQSRVGSLTNGVEFLIQSGFKRDESGENLIMAKEDINMPILQVAGEELNKAITNPFFGLLK